MKNSDITVRKILYGFLMVSGLVIFVLANVFLVPEFQYYFLNLSKKAVSHTNSLNPSELEYLKNKERILEQKINQTTASASPFLVINTVNNTFQLFNRKRQIAQGPCSTGSFLHLEVDSTRSWIFETPKGVLRVRNKIIDPVWRKPDWAFFEEGIQPPPAWHPSRFERGVLGKYALDLGDGYLIHGTLYQRLLGMPVTHGCIRMNDEDLELVYQTLNIGSCVYIY